MGASVSISVGISVGACVGISSGLFCGRLREHFCGHFCGRIRGHFCELLCGRLRGYLRPRRLRWAAETLMQATPHLFGDRPTALPRSEAEHLTLAVAPQHFQCIGDAPQCAIIVFCGVTALLDTLVGDRELAGSSHGTSAARRILRRCPWRTGEQEYQRNRPRGRGCV